MIHHIGYIATGATLPRDLAPAGYFGGGADDDFWTAAESAGITFAVVSCWACLSVRRRTMNSFGYIKQTVMRRRETPGGLFYEYRGFPNCSLCTVFYSYLFSDLVGGDYLKQLLEALPKEVSTGQGVTGGLLSALGLGLLLKYLSRGYLLPFLF